jgi:hypothetical protein
MEVSMVSHLTNGIADFPKTTGLLRSSGLTPTRIKTDFSSHDSLCLPVNFATPSRIVPTIFVPLTMQDVLSRGIYFVLPKIQVVQVREANAGFVDHNRFDLFPKRARHQTLNEIVDGFPLCASQPLDFIDGKADGKKCYRPANCSGCYSEFE